MLINEFIATSVDEVGISALDFFSIGHICMGIGIFLFLSLFYTIPMSKDDGSQVILPLWLVWILTMVLGIAWEFLENILFIELGIKFEGRQDSIINIITDISLVGVGGLGMWLLAHWIFKTPKLHWLYYLLGIIGFALWIGVFIVLRYLTLY